MVYGFSISSPFSIVVLAFIDCFLLSFSMASNSRKRKASSGRSENVYEEEKQQMKNILERFQLQITELNRNLLTVADIKLPDEPGEALQFLLSWRNKNRELIGGHAFQKKDECWAHAFARGLGAAMKQHKSARPLPETWKLFSLIDSKFLSPKGALLNTINVAPILLEEYGCELVIHYQPEMSKSKDFEKFIERRLALGPVAMCFHYLPGYQKFKHKNKVPYRPTVTDIQAMKYERLDGHCAVITGRGVIVVAGEPVEFWEIHETRGERFADGGFTRLERHKCIITEVYEFKFP